MRGTLLPRRLIVVAVAATFVAIAACSDVTSSSSTPATIEFDTLSAVAIVIGDTLRDADGKAVPVRALVRNQQGEILPEAVVRYTYADASRDSALAVDSLEGFVFATKALKTNATFARIAARVGSTLQIIRTLVVTSRPDSADQKEAVPIDTMRVGARDTSTALITTIVRHQETSGTTSRVANWLVKFEILQPANPTNDSTMSVFLVTERDRLSNIDTTDASGIAGRSVRIRGSKFPVGAAADSVVVRINVTFKGQPVKGAPMRVVVPVVRKQ